MSKKDDGLIKGLMDEADRLSREIEQLQKLDLDSILTSGRSRKTTEDDGTPRKPRKTRRETTPDWVLDWERQHNKHGEVKEIVKTTETFHEKAGTITSKTELVEPVVKTAFSRNLKTGEVEETVVSSGLPEHLKLHVLHEDIKQPVLWDRPLTDAVPPHDIARWTSGPGASERAKQLEQWHADNPGSKLADRGEGPTKPIRKQMTRLNKVWRYRNFKKCANCGKFDTWEARTEPYSVDGVHAINAMIWCYVCGSIDFEVASAVPDHVRSWAPPKESEKEGKKRERRQQYRRNRALCSLHEQPKTPIQLAAWFRNTEHYVAVDSIMLELMLKRMQEEGLVEVDKKSGLWQLTKALRAAFDKLK